MAVYDFKLAFARVREWAAKRWKQSGMGSKQSADEMAPHLALGTFGERLAAQKLQSEGYRLVVSNFMAPIGHRRDQRLVTGEIDIIAYDEKTNPPTLVFVEVKTRSSAEWAAPAAAVNRRKQRQIIRAARVYRQLLQITTEPHRYDVVGILVSPDRKTQIELLPAYFNEDVFRRSSWIETKGREFHDKFYLEG